MDFVHCFYQVSAPSLVLKPIFLQENFGLCLKLKYFKANSNFQYSLYCQRSLKLNYSATHDRFPLVVPGKSYLVPSQSVFSLESSSLHGCFVWAVFRTQNWEWKGRSQMFKKFLLPAGAWLAHGWPGYHMWGQHQTKVSLSACFQVGWLQVGCDHAHPVRDKLGFPCTAQLQRQNL